MINDDKFFTFVQCFAIYMVLYIKCPIIFPVTIRQYYYLIFTDEGTEAQR